MVVDMELEERMQYARQLMKDKDTIESDIRAQKEILDSNHVGMDEPLVDSDGYPRQDMDVYQVRHARHKIICLTNDHKALMKKIEEALHKVHALAGNTNNEASTTVSDVPECSTPLEPFLKIDLVTQSSPGDVAGIMVGDLILKFGPFDYENFTTLAAIGSFVQSNINKRIDVRVKRLTGNVDIVLTPRPWAGKGLLGFNIVPIDTPQR